MKLYKKGILITLQNKLTLLRGFISGLRNCCYKKRLIDLTERFELQHDKAEANDIEEINQKFNSVFNYYFNIINRSKTYSKYYKNNDKKYEISEELVNYELSSYDKNKYTNSISAEEKNKKYIKIYQLYRTVMSKISKIITNQIEIKELKDEVIDNKLANINNKLVPVQNIIKDIHKFNLTGDELGKISRVISRSITKAEQIRKNQILSVNPSLNKMNNPEEYKKLYKPVTPKMRIDNRTGFYREKKQINYSNNKAEYLKILTGCQYILQELNKVQIRQLSIEFLQKNFNIKDAFLKALHHYEKSKPKKQKLKKFKNIINIRDKLLVISNEMENVG